MDLNILHTEEDLKIDFEISQPICRICLSTKKNVKNVVPYDPFFRELVGISVMESDGLPQWICSECIALLQKAVRFKQKVLRANDLLYEYLSRCAPFPLDASDTELQKYASPELIVTPTLVCSYNGRGKNNDVEVLQHETPRSLFAPLSPKADELDPPIKIEDVGMDFSSYEDDITLDEYRISTNRLTDEDIKLLLEDPSPIEPKEEPELKKKKKTKKKEDSKGKKRKKISEDTEPEEPKTSVRRKDELDPAKIRVVTLDPEEQLRQREEENKCNLKFPFHCHLCFQGFNFEMKLENHMKKHSPSRGPFECKFCHMHLPTAYSLDVHSLIHTQRYECVQCGRRMTDRASIK